MMNIDLKQLAKFFRKEYSKDRTPFKDMTESAGSAHEFGPGLSPEMVRQFVPFRNLDVDTLAALSYRVETYVPGEVVFNLGDAAEHVLFLMEGSIRIQPDGADEYVLEAHTPQASLPINSGSRYGSSAKALTPLKILFAEAEILHLWLAKNRDSVSCIELDDIALPEAIGERQFFKSFSDAYRDNRLRLPSLPHIVIKLNEALKTDIGFNGVAEIVQTDAAIATKLIQFSNSPLYYTLPPITNCQDAIARLGLAATKNWVMSLSMQQLFQCADPKLTQGMRKHWAHSLYVSSLSFVLAQEIGHVNPDDALLAGLISDIGIIPLLYFTEQSEKPPEFEKIEAAMPYLRGPVGSLVLHTFGFPDELISIPHHAEDWFYDSGRDIKLIDIVILAKLHSLYGTKRASELPHINRIPVYAKLADGQLNPDFSLKILNKAKKRIDAAMRIFS